MLCHFAVGEMKSQNVGFLPTQSTKRYPQFMEAHGGEIKPLCHAGVRMRTLTVSDSDNLEGNAPSQGNLDETPGAEYFVVGVRRHDNHTLSVGQHQGFESYMAPTRLPLRFGPPEVLVVHGQFHGPRPFASRPSSAASTPP